jgi:hypothetical protein
MNSPFDVRATMECGWNIFCREGEQEAPRTISVNYRYLDHLREADINRVIVFWANSRNFDDAWANAVAYAHSIGLKVARAIYGFSGGAREAPEVPAHLLVDSARGPRTALCPHNPETREWLLGTMKKLLEPDIDAMDIEPARHTYRRCLCSQCSAMNPYEWDAFVVNLLAERILQVKADAEVYMHVFAECFERDEELATAYRRLNPNIHHIFGWGVDDEKAIGDWLDLDPRFEQFAKLGRVLLFPGGELPTTPAAERAARVFRWCRFSAEKGRRGFLFDYRIFGGMEWERKGAAERPRIPTTRRSKRMPASIAVMGAAMRNPYLDEKGRLALLDRCRKETDWDLDDPTYFWTGETTRLAAPTV